MALTTAGVIFCATRMLFMLIDKDYFAVPKSEIGTVNSDLIFNAMIGTIPISLVSGYCYDMFGRKLLIIASAFALCMLCYITPYTSPSLYLLQITYIFVRSTMVFVACNPLMADYVDKDSLGKASALQNMGALIGDCFAMAFLITITSELSHENAFYITAILIASLVLPFFFIIKEPNIHHAELTKELQSKKNDDLDQEFESNIRTTVDSASRPDE